MADKSQRIDIDKIDLEKEREKITDHPGLIAFPHHVGSALIKPEDKGKLKGRAVMAMRQQTDRQMSQIYHQVQTLIKQANEIKRRVEVSERIYSAQMNFEPIISHTYFLYEKKDGQDVLSMISPKEWGRSFPYRKYIAQVTLLADHTWEVDSEAEEVSE